jgi:hypothetical protein
MKHIHLTENNPGDNACRSFYIRLAHETEKYGIDNRKIEHTRLELADRTGARVWLKPEAYRPTGIALGHPLPGSRVQSRLFRVSLYIDGFLQKLFREKKPAFAFVPPEAYHITLINWTHYTVSGRITSLGTGEAKKFAEHIPKEFDESQVILINGLILTRSGAVLVPGFPAQESFYRLRAGLYKTTCECPAYPSPPPPLPPAAHIKLGHLLFPLDPPQLIRFQTWLSRWGRHVSGRLVFEDLYTQAGRILLNKG